MILSSAKARWRIARWGESGFIFSTLAFFHRDVSASSRAHASAPTKLGILPAAPGKRAAFFSVSKRQISARISSLLLIHAKLNHAAANRQGQKLRQLWICPRLLTVGEAGL